MHGFASSAEHNWRHPGWLDLLADCGRETIAVDLPGHGTAPKPADPAGYQGVEAHVAAAVQGREPLDAIGFSAGAHVLLRLAADQPGTFRRLALLGIGRGVLEPADPEPIVAALTSDDGFRVGRVEHAPADAEQGQPAERAGLVRGQPQQHVRAGREADGVYWLAALDGRGHVGLDVS